VNKREQQLYQEYLTRLRLKDRKHFHTPAGTVGPLERGLIKATNSGENFEAWVVGFYGEWSDSSDTLAKLPEKLADAQVVRWQSKYGREPTIQQRAWLVSKVRSTSTPRSSSGTSRICTRSPSHPRVRGEGWNCRTGPACKAGDHARADLQVLTAVAPHCDSTRVAVVVEPWDGRDPPADSA
jgi:hypothetical protein